MSNKDKVYSANQKIQDIIYRAESGEIGWGDAVEEMKCVGQKLSSDDTEDSNSSDEEADYEYGIAKI